LVYSFLDESKINSILNTITTNFELYDNIGFFNHYQNILKDYGFKKVSVEDIKEFCNELNNKVFSKGILSVNIEEKHKELYGSKFVRIKSDNNLTIEQIINEIVPLEILEKIGRDITEELKNDKISDVTREIFTNKKEEKQIKDKKETKNSIIKTIEFFNNEIPKNLKDEFLKYCKEIELNKFEYNKFNLEEFGENIVKTVYLWNELENRNILYTDFRSKLENVLMTKDLILTKFRSEENKTSSVKNDEWNFSLDE